MPKTFILDAAPLLNGLLNWDPTSRYVTVPDVMSEVKSKHSKDNIARLPVQVEVLNPSQDYIQKSEEFAKTTGDFYVLSHADLKIIALTLQLTKESGIEEETLTEKGICFPENDDDGWVTHSDLETKVDDDFVGCITRDFALQNVLLRLKLRILSPDGKQIKTVNSWLLRCHACFKQTMKMELKACPKCGGSTLSRVSYSIENGEMQLHLKPNYVFRKDPPPQKKVPNRRMKKQPTLKPIY